MRLKLRRPTEAQHDQGSRKGGSRKGDSRQIRRGWERWECDLFSLPLHSDLVAVTFSRHLFRHSSRGKSVRGGRGARMRPTPKLSFERIERAIPTCFWPPRPAPKMPGRSRSPALPDKTRQPPDDRRRQSPLALVVRRCKAHLACEPVEPFGVLTPIEFRRAASPWSNGSINPNAERIRPSCAQASACRNRRAAQFS